MMEALQIVAGSWPIAMMVIAISAGIVIRRCFKQAVDNSAEVQNLRASQAVVRRES